MNKPSDKPDNEKEKISTVSNPINCRECDNIALSLSQYCWKHMPPKEKTNYKQKIEDWHKKGKSLKGFNLQSAQIPKIHLENADLSDANLFKANLPDSFLSGVKLIKAHLEEANLSGSDLKNANLYNAFLDNASLRNTDLRGKADLRLASLKHAKISNAKFDHANLSGAYLNYADLTGSSLFKANLIKADFTKAIISGSNLEQADLIGSNLMYSEIKNADLRKADFSKAFLMGADLSKSILNETILSEATIYLANLSEAFLYESNLKNAKLNHANLFEVKGLRMSCFTEKLSKIEKNDPEIYQESYLFIKNYYLRMGLTDDASEASFREKTLQRLSYSRIFWRRMEKEYKTRKLEIKETGIRKFFQKVKHVFSHPFLSFKTILYILFWRLYADICGYGEKHLLTIRASFEIIGFFAFIYKILGKFNQTLRWIDSLYFSIVTFSTLGLGDIKPLPVSWGTRITVSLEALIGAFMIALFVWTLARRGAAR